MFRRIMCIAKKLALTSSAFISLVLGVSAAIGSQAESAQAAGTVVPTYGAPAYVDGSPVGGGTDYLQTIEQSQAQYVVSTAAQLKTALAQATSGQTVYVADGATIALNSDSQVYGSVSWIGSTAGFYVKPGVILAGGRSGKISLSPSFRPAAYWYAVALGAGARMSGMIIQGGESNVSNDYRWSGVGCAENSQVDNCEIYGFAGGEAVGCYASNVWVHHNNLHHNQCTSQSGYGVLVYGSYGTPCVIEGNYFDYCKHAIASVADLENWVFRYNMIGPNAKGGQIDSHGNNDGYGPYAGNRIEIYNNTSVARNIWFVQIRGVPNTLVSVHNNWTYLPEDYLEYGGSDWGYAGPIGQIMYSMSGYNAPNQGPFVKMESYDNWYGSSTPPSGNAAPVLSAIGNKSIREGATLVFSVSASDANGDALTYSASNLPTGATFNATNRTLSWTPGLNQAGAYSAVRFQVSDGQMTDYEDITITVIDEAAPVLNAVGNRSTKEGTTLSFSVSASDGNGDALTYSASNLPTGAAFNATTRTFSWTPNQGQTGVYTGIRFEVSDGQMSDYEDITIAVGDGIQADVNSDGSVNSLDMIRVGQHWDEMGEAGWISEDINEDGAVDVLDATLVGQAWTG